MKAGKVYKYAFLAALLLWAGDLVARNVPGARWASGKILVGNASNIAVPVDMSGDATIDNSGAVTVGDVTLDNEAAGTFAYHNGTKLIAGPPGRVYTRIQGSYTAPVAHLNGGAGAVCAGADTTICNVSLGGWMPNMVIYNTGTNDTNEVPEVTVDANCTDGLALPSTNTDNVGGTITFGGAMPNLAASPTVGATCFTAQTDPAFYMKAKIGIPDVSDYDVLVVGFVEPAAAYVAAIDTAGETVTAYDEKAVFALGDNAGDVDTIVSVGGTDDDNDITVTDWTDDDVMTMQVNVSAAGVVTFRWWDKDGTEDTSLGASEGTLAASTVVCPTIIFAKAAAAADTPPIIEYIEWGYQ